MHNCLEQADGGYKVIFWTRYFSIRMLDWGSQRQGKTEPT